MNINFDITLDELINLVLTDAHLTYSVDDVDKLGRLLNDKLENVLDPSEKEFYAGVVESLILEMNEMAEMSKWSDTNPVKWKYDTIGSRLSFDINRSIERGKRLTNTSRISFDGVYTQNNCWSCAFTFHFPDSLLTGKAIASIAKSLKEMIPGYDEPELDDNSKNDLFLNAGPFQKIN